MATAATVPPLTARVDESCSMPNHSGTRPTRAHASAGPVFQRAWLHLLLYRLPLLLAQCLVKDRMELIVRLTMKERAGRQSRRFKRRSKRWCSDKSHPWAEGLTADSLWHSTVVTLYFSPQTLRKLCSNQRVLPPNGIQTVI